MKRKLFILVFLLICLFSFPNTIKTEAATEDSFYANASAYGFSISNDYKPIYMEDFKTYDYKYKEKNIVNHVTTLVEVLLQSKSDSSLYCFIYRICASPLQVRNNGFLGIGSCGDNWYNDQIKTTIQFRNENYKIINFAPQNQPSKTTGTIGVGLDKDGPSVSASVDFEHSDLSIVSNTKTALYKYETIYNYNSNLFHVNSYLASDVYAYGMVSFRYNGVVWVDVKHEIKYYGHIWYGSNSSAGTVVFENTY